MENIILVCDTRLDPLLGIVTGTDTGLADPDHIYTLTDTEVTVRITLREVAPGHITDTPKEAHHATDTQTLIATDGTHHTGDLFHIEALLHFQETAVGLDHILHTKPAKHLHLNLHTALTRTTWKHKDKKYKKVTIDDPHLITTVLMNHPVIPKRI